MADNFTLQFERLLKETKKARLLDGIWIPKSITKRIVQVDEREWHVTVPDWFIEKRELDDLVIDEEIDDPHISPDSPETYAHWKETP